MNQYHKYVLLGLSNKVHCTQNINILNHDSFYDVSKFSLFSMDTMSINFTSKYKGFISA